jgi:tRNA(fMet)-specific endonuclease VapC
MEATRHLAAIKGLLRAFEILDYDAAAGWIAGRVSADLAKAGRPIGDMDTMIAACVIAHDAQLATRNTRHFRRVKGLRLLTGK